MDNIREKLVELIEPHMSGLACEYESGSCELTSCRSCNARNLADHLIANNVTIQEWIPVSEPPKEWRRDNGEMINYLVYVPEFGVDIGNYGEPAKCWLCMGLPCKPTHWAHLPTPPKGVSEEALPVADEATERSVAVEKTEESASPKVLSGTANWR